MVKLQWKYYKNVYLIQDKQRLAKLQDVFLRSIVNDLDEWTKKVKYEKKDDEFLSSTNFYSKNYNGYTFQFDYDKSIGFVENSGVYELVLDYTDYWNGKYPKKVRSVIELLLDNVFTENLGKADESITKTENDKAEAKRTKRSEKLKKLWEDKK